MQIFIVNMVALIFGFSWGYRKKRKKLNNEISVLNNKINELENKVANQNKVEYLRQFTCDPKIKKDVSFLEQTLVNFIYDDDDNYLKCSFLQAIIKRLNFVYDEPVSFFKIKEKMELYKKSIEYKMDTKRTRIAVKKNPQIYEEKNIIDVIDVVNNFLINDLEIDKYSITYFELENTLDFVLSQAWD